MADSTKFDKDAISSNGEQLQSLMDGDVGSFEALKPQWPNAGTFASGQWLERVVDDRRNAIVAHAERLNTALEQLGQRLKTVATDFENADGDNAAKIKKSLEDQVSTTAGDLDQAGADTEAVQHNYTSPKKPEEGNDTDGDGYDDVLP